MQKWRNRPNLDYKRPGPKRSTALLINGFSLVREELFRRRATKLQLTAGIQKFPNAERDAVTELADMFSQTRELQEVIIRELKPEVIINACKAGENEYLRMLKEQPILDGVYGM